MINYGMTSSPFRPTLDVLTILVVGRKSLSQVKLCASESVSHKLMKASVAKENVRLNQHQRFKLFDLRV